jgi:hypothetical protein
LAPLRKKVQAREALIDEMKIGQLVEGAAVLREMKPKVK